MLKVYSHRYYISIDGGDWFEVDDESYHYALRDDTESTTCNILDNITFEECYEWLQNHHLYGIRWNRSIFNKKRIRVMRNWSWDQWDVYKDFGTISYKCVYTECPNVTLASIFKHFPADQCIQYMKERGMTVCPMSF